MPGYARGYGDAGNDSNYAGSNAACAGDTFAAGNYTRNNYANGITASSTYAAGTPPKEMCSNNDANVAGSYDPGNYAGNYYDNINLLVRLLLGAYSLSSSSIAAAGN